MVRAATSGSTWTSSPALRLLLDPAAVGLLQWTLPEHVQNVGIERERVVVQTVASR
jgi:hypothetical protein